MKSLVVLLTCSLAGWLIGADAQSSPTSTIAVIQSHPKAILTTTRGVITIELFANECPQTVANFTGLAMGTKPFTDPISGGTVTKPFYQGLFFHRVIKGFMIQAGCPKGDGSSGPGFVVPDEINATSLGLDQELALQGDELNPQCAYQMQDFTRLFIWPRMQELGITAQSTPAQRAEKLPKAIAAVRQVTLRQFYEKLGYKYDDRLPASHKPVRGSVAMANAGPGSAGSQFFINLGDTPHLTGKYTVFGQVIDGMEVVDVIGAGKTGPRDLPLEPVVIVSVRVTDR